MSRITWEEFYAQNVAPSSFESNKQLIESFCAKFAASDCRVVLITSGGTTVPLEKNTVRFVDNFSAGTRGSASAEYFLKAGYAVIFLHRLKTLEPFVRHFSGKDLLDSLQVTDNDSVQVDPSKVSSILPVLKERNEAMKSGRFLMISFTTLTDYLWLLRASAASMATLGPRAMLYLAAAVSDFYLPLGQLPEHKIQSSGAPPVISLELVPKILSPLVKNWVPNGFVVSFKLETDANLLIPKSEDALKNYGHKVVVANELHSRTRKVILVMLGSHHVIELNQEQLNSGFEIEHLIVNDLAEQHCNFINA